jgi:purine-binding chemotaxis protein CheW
MSKETNATAQSYLSFKIGEELFAANVLKVVEILEVSKITKVPKSPDYMRGVVNLRGSVLPVIDTRLKFGMPAAIDTVDTCIMVLTIQMENESFILGALVDAVQEVFEITDDQIKSAPTIGSKYKSEFIDGMIRLNEEFIMLLNVDKVFSSDEIITVKESSSQPVLQ